MVSFAGILTSHMRGDPQRKSVFFAWDLGNDPLEAIALILPRAAKTMATGGRGNVGQLNTMRLASEMPPDVCIDAPSIQQHEDHTGTRAGIIICDFNTLVVKIPIKPTKVGWLGAWGGFSREREHVPPEKGKGKAPAHTF